MSFDRAGQRRAPAGEPDWLTLGQAAKFLGVAQSTIRKWSDQGRVPAFYTPGGHRRYRRRDLEQFLEQSGPGGREAGPLVLIVDDDARFREFIRVNLEMEGYAVVEAGSAEEGLAAVDEQVPDLILRQRLRQPLLPW
jgi:excisionase family DNA binding protein